MTEKLSADDLKQESIIKISYYLDKLASSPYMQSLNKSTKHENIDIFQNQVQGNFPPNIL